AAPSSCRPAPCPGRGCRRSPWPRPASRVPGYPSTACGCRRPRRPSCARPLLWPRESSTARTPGRRPGARSFRYPEDMDEDVQRRLDIASRTAVHDAAERLGLSLDRIPRIEELTVSVKAAAEGDYEEAMVAGLCHDGACEVFRGVAEQEAERQLKEL